MDYFSVSFPAGFRLGMSIIARDESQLLLGNTVVDSVEETGYAKKGNVKSGDYIVSVNERYVAFESNIDVVKMLQGIIMEQKTVTIYFCRPNKFDWNLIYSSSEQPIKEGMVQKLHSGIFRKWNTRNISLTRETFSYSSDGVLKGKYSLDSEVGSPRVAAGYPNQQGVFEVKCGEKEFTLQTNSTHARNTWIHALDCAIKKVFNRNVDGLSPVQNSNANNHKSHHQSLPASIGGLAMDDPGNASYLQMGREARSATNHHNQGHRSMRLHREPNSSSNFGFAISKMLDLCNVQAASGPDSVVSLEGIKDPSLISPALLDYDFSLEQSILDK